MKKLVTFRVEQNDSLGCRLSHLSSTDFLGGLLCGPIFCIIECLAAFLASVHQMPVVHPFSCDSQKCLLPDVP